MVKVDDVAALILERSPSMNIWKLQRLCYYCQAWHLTWEGRSLFSERIEAWARGPSIPVLYEQAKAWWGDTTAPWLQILAWPLGDSAKLTANEVETVEAVLKYYGSQEVGWLNDLSSREEPCRRARRGLADFERGYRHITNAAMQKYYRKLLAGT